MRLPSNQSQPTYDEVKQQPAPSLIKTTSPINQSQQPPSFIKTTSTISQPQLPPSSNNSLGKPNLASTQPTETNSTRRKSQEESHSQESSGANQPQQGIFCREATTTLPTRPPIHCSSFLILTSFF